jgi:hypothetical protein
MTGPLTRAGRLLWWFVRPFAGQEPSFYRAVTACLLASGLFWQMNALNKTYTTRLSYPLVWRYDTTHYLPLRPLPAALPVTVTGQGWRLLRANLGLSTRPAELRPVPLPGTRYLPPAVWRRGLQTALEGLQVNEWAGDTLRLTFDRYATRQLTLALSPSDSLRRYAARFTPASLTFRGPASVVSALPDPYLVALPAGHGKSEVAVSISSPTLVRASARQVRVSLEPATPKRRRHSSFNN